MKRLVALSTLALGTALAAQPALAAPAAAATSPGQVFALANTPQLFITDDQGAAHFVGDTRALPTFCRHLAGTLPAAPSYALAVTDCTRQ